MLFYSVLIHLLVLVVSTVAQGRIRGISESGEEIQGHRQLTSQMLMAQMIGRPPRGGVGGKTKNDNKGQRMTPSPTISAQPSAAPTETETPSLAQSLGQMLMAQMMDRPPRGGVGGKTKTENKGQRMTPSPTISVQPSAAPTETATPSKGQSLICSIDDLYLVERLNDGHFTLPNWSINSMNNPIWPFETYTPVDGGAVEQTPSGGTTYYDPQKISVTFSAEDRTSCSIIIDLIDDDAIAASLLDEYKSDSTTEDDGFPPEYSVIINIDECSCTGNHVFLRLNLTSIGGDVKLASINGDFVYLWLFEDGSQEPINDDFVKVFSSSFVDEVWVLEFSATIVGACSSGNIEVTGGGTPNFDFVGKSSFQSFEPSLGPTSAGRFLKEETSPAPRGATARSPDSFAQFPTVAPSDSPSPSQNCAYCHVKKRCSNSTTAIASTSTSYENCINGYRYANFMADVQGDNFSLSGTATDTCSSSIVSDTTASAEVENAGKSRCHVWIEGPDCCQDQFDVACDIDLDLIAEIRPPNSNTLDDEFATATVEFETPCFSSSVTILVNKETGSRRRVLQSTTASDTVTI
jgi:hypothetical protein